MHAVLNHRDACRWATLCVALGSGLILITIARTSLTFDEPYFYTYGQRIVFDGHFARTDPIDDSKLPVSALNVLPEWAARHSHVPLASAQQILGRWWSPREAAYLNAHLPIYAGRLVTIGFYVALCWLAFVWGEELYGPAGALAATALIGFLPMVLGHAALVTVDVAASCTMFAAVYALAHSLLRPSARRAVIAGLALGLAQLVKYTAIELVAVAPALLALRVVLPDPGWSRRRRLRTGIVSLVLSAAVALVIVNVGFAFQGSGVRLNDLACDSHGFQVLRHAIGRWWIPLPYEYLNGLDQVLKDDQEIGTPVYLMGEVSHSGFPWYYAVATALKTPLPFLALLLVRPWRRHRQFHDLVLVVPVAVLFVHLSFFFRTQIGLRYFLPAFPFLALLAAGNWERARAPRWRAAATGLLSVTVAAVALQCPHYLAYFNALTGSQLNAHRYLADSNLDWGQDLFALWAWEGAHAGEPYELEPYAPVHGVVIVRSDDFLGLRDPQAYRWLRASGAAPQSTIGSSYLLFNVPATGKASARLAAGRMQD